ncbi:hypothetical protein [Azospirillum palustre]
MGSAFACNRACLRFHDRGVRLLCNAITSLRGGNRIRPKDPVDRSRLHTRFGGMSVACSTHRRYACNRGNRAAEWPPPASHLPGSTEWKKHSYSWSWCFS